MADSWESLKDAGYNKEVYRNAAALELHRACKVGRELTPNAKVEKIHFGSNDKVVILGQGMSSRVEPAAEVLRKEGYTVELFNKECQTKTFNIDGKNYTFGELENDFTSLAKEKYDGSIPYDKSNSIILNDVQNSLLYKANKQFIQRIMEEDYTIILIGKTAGSFFCDLENEIIKKKNLKWWGE